MSESSDNESRNPTGRDTEPLPDLPAKLPRHIAFIMDGNGRWARSRGLPRLRGHETGADSLRGITRFCRSIGIAEVTFYALSTENYQRRPAREISFLMRLLSSYLTSERREMLENGIRLTAIGRLQELPAGIRTVLRETEELTARQTGMVVRLALNYGGRQEIIDAVRKMLQEPPAEGRASGSEARIDEAAFRRYLYDPEMSDPDLLVRTAGELRLSNFLLWHSSYSEIWVTPSFWPEFDVPELVQALWAFDARKRKYGAVEPPDGLDRSTGSGRVSGGGRHDGGKPA